MRFETKTRVVEAEQYRHGVQMPEGVFLRNTGREKPEAYVTTKGGVAKVEEGDWVFKDIDAHYVVYSDTIFRLLFRSVA